MSEGGEQPTAVGIGIIRRGREFLIRQRPPGTVYAGYWEFPGGKCEPGETPAEATCRECQEEVGLTIVIERLRQVRTHRYPHGLVELWFHDCALLEPGNEPSEHTGFVWIDGEKLQTLRFPEANAEVLAELANENRNRDSGRLR
jgi:8-oxo-dGTP diphosphatase